MIGSVRFLVLPVAANGAHHVEAVVRRKPRVAEQDIDLLPDKAWNRLIELSTSRSLLAPKPRSMPCITRRK